MVIMIVLLILEYLFIFIPLAASLNDESKHSKLMFLLVPFETVLHLPDIVAMLGQHLLSSLFPPANGYIAPLAISLSLVQD